jgi:hypothetical protein
MDGEFTDQQFTARVATVGGQAGQGQAVVNELAVQGGENSAHDARIAKVRGDIKGKSSGFRILSLSALSGFSAERRLPVQA